GERWLLEELAPVRVAGGRDALLLWALRASPGSLGIDVEHASDVPLVGRGRELDALAAALQRARDDEEPQLVTLAGHAGIGKTRLVYELRQRVDALDEVVKWRQGRSLPGSAPFAALAEIVTAEAGGRLDDLVRDVVDSEQERAWVERETRALLGLAEAGGERGGDGFGAWRRLVEGMAARRPLVLVFEDLHWADDLLPDWLDPLPPWASD